MTEPSQKPLLRASQLSKARYLGSAKSGTHHWWMQRVSAVALLVLGLWFLNEVITTPGLLDYEIALVWLQSPFHSVLLILLLGVGFYHGALGLQTVIEDYIHTPFAKYFTLYLVKFIAIVLFVFATFSVVRVQNFPILSDTVTNVLVNVEPSS